MASLRSLIDFTKFDPRKRLHFRINLTVGVLIAVLFLLAADTQWGESVMNEGFDILVRLENRMAASRPVTLQTSPLYLIEITEENYRNWGEPLLTPRDQLAQFVESAWQRNAKVVALDVLLERPDCQHPSGDQKLRALLERMLAGDSKTQVILPVSLDAGGRIRKNLFDDLIDRTTPSGRKIFYRGTTAIESTAADRLNRYWVPYLPGRDGRGVPQVVWSVPVLATALASPQGYEPLSRLAPTLLRHSEADGARHGAAVLHLAGRELEIPTYHEVGTGPGAAGFDVADSHARLYLQRIRFLLTPETPSTLRIKMTADNVAPGANNLLPDLSGKIVLVGNLSPDLMDMHWTPVGRIAGAYVLANAINTVSRGLQPVHLNTALHLLIEFLVIFVAAHLFLHFTSLLAEFLTCGLFILVFFPISWFIYLRWGLFFNFVVPLIGMGFHRTASSIEETLSHRGRRPHH